MPFEMSLAPDHVTVEAGQSAEIAVTIRNLDAEERQYTLEVLGLDPAVYQLPQPNVAVPGGGVADSTVVLCPPAGGNIRTATYSFRICATAGNREQHTTSARITIMPALALNLELAAVGRDRFEVTVLNEANRELEVRLQAEDPRGTAPAQGCDYLLERSVLRLAVGESARVPLRVRPRRRPLLGVGRSHPFTVRVTPEIRNARAETLEGLARSTAVIPWWVPLLLLLAIAAGTFALMNRAGRAPVTPSPIAVPRAPTSSRALPRLRSGWRICHAAELAVFLDSDGWALSLAQAIPSR